MKVTTCELMELATHPLLDPQPGGSPFLLDAGTGWTRVGEPPSSATPNTRGFSSVAAFVEGERRMVAVRLPEPLMVLKLRKSYSLCGGSK